MMTNKKTVQHTPGPWCLMTVNGTIDLKGNNGNTLIASWETGDDGIANPFNEEDSANLRLITSAPDLLEALRAVLDSEDTTLGDGGSILGNDLRTIARAAIVKAKGG